MDSVSEAMEEHHIISLIDRREQLDIKLMNKIQLGDYDIDLKDRYVTASYECQILEQFMGNAAQLFLA